MLELPLVIGTAGLGSRSSSVSSHDGSVSSLSDASLSWQSLRLPSHPPSYCSSVATQRDCRLEQPLTPLLHDFDEDEDDGLFMNAPVFQYPPPPAYSEVGDHLVLAWFSNSPRVQIDSTN